MPVIYLALSDDKKTTIGAMSFDFAILLSGVLVEYLLIKLFPWLSIIPPGQTEITLIFRQEQESQRLIKLL